jgi:hypothetical protein
LVDREHDGKGQQPSPAELLRAALEKIVFFEWRLSELAGELASAEARTASAEKARAEAEDDARAATALARTARNQCAELEAERARMNAMLARPARVGPDPAALDAERRRSAGLAAELAAAQAEISRARAERERILAEMISQARIGEEAPAALAQFISELRAEVIALRDHQKKCEALLAGAGIAPPVFEPAQLGAAPSRQAAPEPVEQARTLWSEGRLAAAPALTTHFPLPPEPNASAAARALADQCLRSLSSPDSSRREQAARHLVAAPLLAAAPSLAAALSQESEPKARAQLARALAACGGEGAADIVAQLQGDPEPALVRLAALEALCSIPARAAAALRNAAGDAAPAVRRRAAALAVSEGLEDLVAQLAADEESSVRAAVAAARSEAAAPAPARAPVAPPDAPSASPPAPASARPRDPVRAALRRLVLEGGSR